MSSPWGYGRVLIEQGARAWLQGIEPGVVVAPVFEPLVEDRLAYLLGARRAYRTRVLVEPEAPRLEGQLAVGEQAPHLGFRIGDDRLVEDPVDPLRNSALDLPPHPAVAPAEPPK